MEATACGRVRHGTPTTPTPRWWPPGPRLSGISHPPSRWSLRLHPPGAVPLCSHGPLRIGRTGGGGLLTSRPRGGGVRPSHPRGGGRPRPGQAPASSVHGPGSQPRPPGLCKKGGPASRAAACEASPDERPPWHRRSLPPPMPPLPINATSTSPPPPAWCGPGGLGRCHTDVVRCVQYNVNRMYTLATGGDDGSGGGPSPHHRGSVRHAGARHFAATKEKEPLDPGAPPATDCCACGTPVGPPSPSSPCRPGDPASARHGFSEWVRVRPFGFELVSEGQCCVDWVSSHQ